MLLNPHFNYLKNNNNPKLYNNLIIKFLHPHNNKILQIDHILLEVYSIRNLTLFHLITVKQLKMNKHKSNLPINPRLLPC